MIPAFYESAIPAVRAFDPATPATVGAGATYDMKHTATSLLTGVDSVLYTADILSFAATDPDVLKPATDFRAGAKVPIFIQQVGIKKSDADAEALVSRNLAALADAKIDWTWWTYREPSSAFGDGFAPYDKANQATEWQLDRAWLDSISGYFD